MGLAATAWFCNCMQAVYSEDISKQMGNEPLVQALKELMKYEMAMLVTEDEDDKDTVRTESTRSKHDNVHTIHGLTRQFASSSCQHPHYG